MKFRTLKIFSIKKCAVFAFGSIAAIALAWLGDALAGGPVTAHWWPVDWAIASWYQRWPLVVDVVISSAVFLLSSGLAALSIQLAWPVRSLQTTKNIPPHRGLILNLSIFPPSWAVDVREEGVFLIDGDYELNIAPDALSALAVDKRIEAVIALLENDEHFQRCNWLQLLRGIKPHVARLSVIKLVNSVNGSDGIVDDCSTWLKCLLDDVIIEATSPIDMEDFGQCYHVFQTTIGDWESALGLKEDDIILDCTGGPKTVGISSALATLHRSIAFQYINNKGESLFYDLEIDN